jgi:hypothetical protein
VHVQHAKSSPLAVTLGAGTEARASWYPGVRSARCPDPLPSVVPVLPVVAPLRSVMGPGRLFL